MQLSQVAEPGLERLMDWPVENPQFISAWSLRDGAAGPLCREAGAISRVYFDRTGRGCRIRFGSSRTLYSDRTWMIPFGRLGMKRAIFCRRPGCVTLGRTRRRCRIRFGSSRALYSDRTWMIPLGRLGMKTAIFCRGSGCLALGCTGRRGRF